MTTTRITDAQFQAAQRKLDALTRSTRRGRTGTPEEITAYQAAVTAWEAAIALPQRTQADLAGRDAALLTVAIEHRLI